MSSVFSGVEKGPAIEVFALNKACVEDSNPNKVNLGVGGKCHISQAISTKNHTNLIGQTFLERVEGHFKYESVCVCVCVLWIRL